MSTPFDINVPVEPNGDVVINHQDATQSVGTPTELQAAVDQGDVIGLQTDAVVDTAVEVPAEALVAEEAAEPEAPAKEQVEAPVEEPVEAPVEEEVPVEEVAPEVPGKAAGK